MLVNPSKQQDMKVLEEFNNFFESYNAAFAARSKLFSEQDLAVIKEMQEFPQVFKTTLQCLEELETLSAFKRLKVTKWEKDLLLEV